jgi:hypothetical protein
MKYQRKWAMLSLLVLGAALICHGSASAQTKESSAAVFNLPLWEYTTTSPADGNTYTGWMVGRSPYAHGMRTTNIQTFIVPLIVSVTDGLGGTFDPTAADTTCLGTGATVPNVPLTLFQESPVLTNSSFSMGSTNVGSTEYPDAFQRGNFWNAPANVAATGNSYHTLLANVTTLAPQTISLPSGDGASYASSAFAGSGGCGNFVVADYNTLNGLLAGTGGIIPQLLSAGTITPSSLVIFLTHEVVEAYNGAAGGESASSNCCSLGFHSGYAATTVAPNSPVETYVTADFDSTNLFGQPNVASIAHQVSAWIDDPLGTSISPYNVTPAWSAPAGNLATCFNSLDPGYPLLGALTVPGTAGAGITVAGTNGFTYNLQELAFFSWFYRDDPSFAVNNWFSSNDTLTTDAGAVCGG